LKVSELESRFQVHSITKHIPVTCQMETEQVYVATKMELFDS